MKLTKRQKEFALKVKKLNREHGWTIRYNPEHEIVSLCDKSGSNYDLQRQLLGLNADNSVDITNEDSMSAFLDEYRKLDSTLRRLIKGLLDK